MQISVANSRAAFESRASKFLVTNRTLSYSAQVSGSRKIWYHNAWHTSKVTGTSFWYQKKLFKEEIRNLSGELGSCAMDLTLATTSQNTKLKQ